MRYDIDYGGDPAEWVNVGGAPARCLGDPREGGGMPSFEMEEPGLDRADAFHVYDFLQVMPESDGGAMLVSDWYMTGSILAEDGLMPLHHEPTQLWVWRPVLYKLLMIGWVGIGSQRELWWRKGLREVQIRRWDRENGEMSLEEFESKLASIVAEDKAERLLDEFLTGPQRFELTVTAGRGFKVRGGDTGHIYRVRVGDGFERIHATTEECITSYCLHPEYWMPDADVALAQKVHLEDPELEAEILEGGQGHGQVHRGWPESRMEVVAEKLERELVR